MDKELRIKLLVILQYTLEDYDKYKAKGAEYYSEVRYNWGRITLIADIFDLKWDTENEDSEEYLKKIRTLLD